MFVFRVTKYNPAYRDRRGSYLRDEWTSGDNIGRVFTGEVLTPDAYQRVEDVYAATTLDDAAVRVRVLAGGPAPRWAILARAMELRKDGLALKTLSSNGAAS